MLNIKNIEVVYNEVVLVIKGLSLELHEGEIVALLGANGAGKSTTLKAVSGLLKTEDGEVTKGSIFFNKKEIIELAENILAQNAPKASLKLVEVMDSADPIPQANVRLQAAQTLLDRVGLSKTDKLDVNLQTSNGLFILPAKKEVVIEGQYEEA